MSCQCRVAHSEVSSWLPQNGRMYARGRLGHVAGQKAVGVAGWHTPTFGLDEFELAANAKNSTVSTNTKVILARAGVQAD
jgi:hypothetical protein